MYREKMRLAIMIGLTGVLVLATVTLTVTALKPLQRTRPTIIKEPGSLLTQAPGWLFAQDSLKREPFTFDSELAAAKIHPLAVEDNDPLVNRLLDKLLATPPGASRFKTDTVIHLALPSRQGRAADLVVMHTLQEQLRSNRLSGKSREAVQKDLDALQAEITGGVGMDRFTREVRY